MKMQAKKTMAVLTLGSFLLASLLGGCGGSKEETQKEEVKATVPVAVQTLKTQGFDKVITLGGLTAAESTVNVIPKVAGMEQIKTVNVKVGDRVKEGQVLAQLDNESSAINANSAALAVENAEGSIEVAQMALENAERTYNNMLELYEIGAISENDLNQAKMGRDNAASQLNAARIGAANARNTLQSAQMALDYATVTAPISGTVTMVNATEGSFATASAPMFEISNVDTLKVSTGINEQNVSKIHVGQEVLMRVVSVSDQWFSGTITEISKVMNSQTKNYPITIALKNQNQDLVAGMYAEINVVVDHADNAIVIPVNAIVYKESQPVAYVLQEDDTVREVLLTLGINDGDFYVVTDGLKAGDQLIVKGNSDLVHGDAVTVITRDGVDVDIVTNMKDENEEEAEASAEETK